MRERLRLNGRMAIRPSQPPARRRRARRGEGELLRDELVNAAETLLLSLGDERELTIRDVASRVGVTSPSVYRHFADKDALVDAVCLRAWDALALRMQAAAEQTQDPFQALRHLGAAYVGWGVEHAVQYRLLLMAPQRVHGGTRAAAARACLDHLTAAVRPCVTAGVMLGDPEQLTMSMWSALHGYVSLRITQPELPWPNDLDQLGEHVARMSGLGTAVLTRIEQAALTPSPTSKDYRVVLDDAVEALRKRGRR